MICITGKADKINGKFMKNITYKVYVDSRGGARTTVERFTIIFLLATTCCTIQQNVQIFNINEGDW